MRHSVLSLPHLGQGTGAPDAWSIGAAVVNQLFQVYIKVRAHPLLCWRIHSVKTGAVEAGAKHAVAALMQLTEGIENNAGCVG
jgi:hypothetical protein